ncbi:acyl-CoA thioesterase [Acidisphaera rubrifaciens]|uniref:Esterase n=1 Tax=Acidisphaera rubrifaciens HS-AP3 TaxID=1231350 RepID=A0A0D6PAQ7_9PROT|nr:thioesterase family protein [Acidisphaera rubrifaciens]GAN78278.1 esterase [Acidisphaera rubrifaciens HS-AP3]
MDRDGTGRGAGDEQASAGAVDLTRRETFAHWSRDLARWGDTDRIGHLNNAVFATFFETGRVSLIHDRTLMLGPPGTLFVIARLAIDFRAEMHWPGEVEIGTGLLRIGRSSVTLGQALFQAGRCTATAESTLVLIDAATRRATPFPPASRATFHRFALPAHAADAADEDRPGGVAGGLAGGLAGGIAGGAAQGESGGDAVGQPGASHVRGGAG